MSLSGGQGEPSKAQRPLRVLVADDDRDTAMTLMMVLHDEGIDVRAVYSGRSAMSTAITYDPDVVVLDINMPDMSGWQVAQTLRARHQTRPLLIGISGVFTKSPDKILANVSGFDHYFVKPYVVADLLKLLEPLRKERRT